MSGSPVALPRVIDGGELYFMRNPPYNDTYYNNYYIARKEEIISTERFYTVNGDPKPSEPMPDYITPFQQTNWPRWSIAFGHIDNTGADLPASIAEIKSSLLLAAKYSDDYSWLYSEEWNWNVPIGTSGLSPMQPATAEMRTMIQQVQSEKVGSSKLLYYNLFGYNDAYLPRVSFFVANAAYFQSVNYFDGHACYVQSAPAATDYSRNLSDNDVPVSYATLNTVLSPMRGLNLGTRATDNFVMAFIFYANDVFDDWTVTIQNFANLARAAYNNGFKGIIIDDEAYDVNFWYSYTNAIYKSTKTYDEYQTQAALRGKQFMDAILAEFPTISIMGLIAKFWSYNRGHPYGLNAELLAGFWVGALQSILNNETTIPPFVSTSTQPTYIADSLTSTQPTYTADIAVQKTN